MPVYMSAVLCVCACVCAVYKEAWRTESIKRVCCVIIVSVRAIPNRSTHDHTTSGSSRGYHSREAV